MKLKSKRAALILGVIILLILFVLLLLPRLHNKAIRIKTALSPSDVSSTVELTSGILYFKSEADVYGEMTEEERNTYKAKPSDYLPEYDKSITVNKEDITRVLNIDPSKWRIPDRLAFQYEHFNVMIGLISAESPEADYSDDVLYSREYRSEDNSRFVIFDVALPGRRWIRDTDVVGQSVKHVKTVYGKLDSRIGDMPLSILNCESSPWDRDFEAYFIAGNAAYFIRTNGMTQQEFVELLISIYEAPRPVTEEAISALYDVAIAK